MSAGKNATLLILDDEPMIVRLIARTFNDAFDRIHFATTPCQAESILKNNVITHFICDSNLGPYHPPGIELIDRWSDSYPHIRKAILFTGLPLDSVPSHAGVEVVSKSDSPQAILENLRISLHAPDIMN